MSQKFKAIGTVMTTVGGVITAALATLVYKTVTIEEEFGHMSERTGETVENLSALAYAAEQSGTSIDQIELSMKFLTKTMADAAAGTGKANDVFTKLGLSVKDNAGNLKPMVEMLKEVATKIAAMKNPVDQANVAMELFGARSGTQLLPMLKMGANGIDEFMKKAKELHLVISDEDVESAKKFDAAMKDLKASLAAAGREIAEVLIPPLTDFMKWATEIIKKIRDWADAHKPLVDMLVKVAAAVGILGAVGGPILMATSAFLKMKGIIDLIPTSMKATEAGTISLGGVLALLFANILIWTEVWKEFDKALHTKYTSTKDIEDAYKILADAQQETAEKIGITVEKLKEYTTAGWTVTEMIAGVKDTTSEASESFTNLAGALDLVNKMAGESGITVESLTKDIEELSASFELSQKYITENNKSMSDTIKYYNSMISLMTNLDSGLKIELETLQDGTEEYKKKVEEMDKNTKALNDMKAALDAALAPLEGLDLIAAKMALLGTTAIDNKTKLGLLGEESILLKKKLDASVPDSTEWWKWNTALNTNIQSVKDLNQAIADSQLASLDAKLTYITGKFNEGEASVSGYKDQIWTLEKELPLLQENLDKATPESSEWYAATTAVDEHKKAIKDLTTSMDTLALGVGNTQKELAEGWDTWRKTTLAVTEVGVAATIAGDATKKAADISSDSWNKTVTTIREATIALSNFTKEGVAAAIATVNMKFANALSTLYDQLENTSRGGWGSLARNMINEQIKNVREMIAEQTALILEGWKKYQDVLSSLNKGESKTSKVSSYQEGTPYVPKTGLYQLHQGEAVIPKNQNTTNNNSNSFSPSIVINASGGSNPQSIAFEVKKVLEDSARQFRRSGFELVPGRG
jgi:methyl-accepting chemotaxis protein